MKLLNTHYYDGKIKWKFLERKTYFADSNNDDDSNNNDDSNADSNNNDDNKKKIIPLDQCWNEIYDLILTKTKPKSVQRKKALLVLQELKKTQHFYM